MLVLLLAMTAWLAVPVAPAGAAPPLVVDTSPGTAAPPPTLGGNPMTAVTTDPRPNGTLVTTIPTPLGDLTLDRAATVREVPGSWGSWSHGYTGTVYNVLTAVVTVALPNGIGAFYMYVEGDGGVADFTVTAQDGTSATASIDSYGGARYFGFYSPSASTPLSSVTVSGGASTGLAFGEFGIAPESNATLTTEGASAPAGTPVAYQMQLPTFAGGGSVVPDSLEISPKTSATGASCTATACSATTAGVYTVIGTYTDPVPDDAYFAYTTLTVTPGPTTSVDITPKDATTQVGTAVPYTVLATDAYGNVTTDPATVTATLSGGVEALPCPAQSCSPPAPGDYTVEATVGGVTTSTSLSVIDDPTTLTLTPVGPLTYGDELTPEATVTSPSGTPTGTVQFAVDGTTVGTPVTVGAAGVATGAPASGLGAGVHTLTAAYDPAGAFAPATAELVLVVSQAPTTTVLTVTSGSLSATITSPAGTPAGDVRFAIDGKVVATVALVGGIADYAASTAGGEDSVATATYLGSADHRSSADSTARLDPTVTASVAVAPSALGWYNAPVEVAFTCVAGSAPVTCPAPVTIAAEGARQTVTRTVVADDGGIAVVTSEPVSIDLTAPSAALRGVQGGRTYRVTAPTAGCVGNDTLSGVASCHVATTGSAPGALITTATVTDLAGNVTTATASYRVTDVWVTRSKLTSGAWQLPIGERRLLTVITLGRPSLTRLNGTPIAPARLAGRIRGQGVWTFAVKFAPGTRVGRVLVTRLTTPDSTRRIRFRAVG